MQLRQIALSALLIGALPVSYVVGQETNAQLPAEKPLTAPKKESPLPKVERGFNAIGVKDWEGKRFSEIISPRKIQRIVLTQERSSAQFGEGRFVPEGATAATAFEAVEAANQAAYDAFIAQAVASPEKAQRWGLGANEHELAELMVLTTDDQLFRIEIVKSRTGKGSSALLIYGQNQGARIEISNSPFIESRR